MKIAFSTLGCPEWTWEDMLVTARDIGYDGIEVRGIEKELHVPFAKPFLPENTGHTRQRLRELELEIPCLTSSCFLFEKETSEKHRKEGNEYIDAAAKLKVPFVRVLGDRDPAPGKNIDTGLVLENLLYLAGYAEKHGVKVLVETNGIFADSKVLLELINKASSSNIGVLWDIHHPYRFMKESVEETYRVLKDLICHVHIKDSVIENGSIRYKMTGYGDIPVKEAVELLRNNGFSGYVSLEWVKRWCMDLEEPGIVFSHFANYMRTLK